MKLDIDNPEAMMYECLISFSFHNSLTGATSEPKTGSGVQFRDAYRQAVCTHPYPNDFRLPSGVWVRKCGTCCATWSKGRMIPVDSTDDISRVETGKPDWKPEATWISKRRFVKDALPDAEFKRGLFGKLAVVSHTFSEQTGGRSLTGWQYWQYEGLKQIWTRAYNQLTQFDYDSVALRHVIRQARAKMVEREKGRGRIGGTRSR